MRALSRVASINRNELPEYLRSLLVIVLVALAGSEPMPGDKTSRQRNRLQGWYGDAQFYGREEKELARTALRR